MKNFFRYLVSFAACLAVLGSVADDGGLIVMDRSYYESCKASFYSSCSTLHQQVQDFSSSAIGSFQNIYSLVSSAIYWVDLANNNAVNLAQSSTLNNSYDRERANLIITQTENANNILRTSLGRISEITNSIVSEATSLEYQISEVSNSFPVAVSATNLELNIYVVVSNSFEFSSNLLDNAQNSYTNFLTYFRGIEDYLLDQYRATITNLLDMANLPYYIDSTFWNTTRPRSTYKYMNFDFIQGYTLGNVQMFPSQSGSESQLTWVNRYWQIPDSSSYNQFLNFSIEGIHDAVQYSAKTLIETRNLLWQACTNKTFSYELSAQQTNDMTFFLSAPDSYSQQVNKASRSRNFFQRIELWLSAIAKNTFNSPEDKTDIPSDLDQERQQEANGITETVTNQFAYIHGEFNDLSNSSTNAFTVAARVVGDFTNCLHHFTMSTSPSRAGPSGSGSAAADRFAKMSVMEMSWFSSRLNELTNKGNNIPDHLMIQDKPSGAGKNTVWSTSLKMADIAHDVFGVLWVLVGFGMTILLCIHVTKTFILIWCMLLHYIPNIARYSLGS